MSWRTVRTNSATVLTSWGSMKLTSFATGNSSCLDRLRLTRLTWSGKDSGVLQSRIGLWYSRVLDYVVGPLWVGGIGTV